MVSILERDDRIASRPNDNSKEENDYSHYQVIYSPPYYKKKKFYHFQLWHDLTKVAIILFVLLNRFKETFTSIFRS